MSWMIKVGKMPFICAFCQYSIVEQKESINFARHPQRRRPARGKRAGVLLYWKSVYLTLVFDLRNFANSEKIVKGQDNDECSR